MEDLASRDGSPNSSSCSCHSGLRASAVQQFRRLLGSNVLNTVSIDYIMSMASDYNADKSQPMCSITAEDEDFEQERLDGVIEYEYSPELHDESFNKYYRRLEDIHIHYLQKYLYELVYAECMYKDGTVRTHLHNHVPQRVLVDEENGAVYSESDLETDDDGTSEWPQHEISEALSKLPYVVKRLHNLSILFGVHMLSFISAYKAATEENSRMLARGSTKTLKVNDVVDCTVYLCDEKGNPTYAPSRSAKNLRIAGAFKWCCGMSDSYQAYLPDMHNFMHYIDVLNIDIMNDDMTRYNAKFMDNVIVATLTPANQYDPAVFSNLCGKEKHVDDVVPDVIDQTLCLFDEMCYSVPELKEAACRTLTHSEKSKIESYSILLASEYYSSRGATTDWNSYRFVNGFLHYNNDMCIIGTEVFMNTSQNETCGACVISDIGYIIGLSSNMFLRGITVTEAYYNYTKGVCESTSGGFKWTTWVNS